jgi:hypothetical protein
LTNCSTESGREHYLCSTPDFVSLRWSESSQHMFQDLLLEPLM